jgi:hypothetical protein
MTFSTVMTSNHLRSISFSGARGMFLDFKDYSLKLIICRSHLSNVLSCLMQKYNFKATKCMFKCAFSHRKVISKSTPTFSQACGASGNSQAFTGTARSPGALFLTVSEGGTKPKKLKIFPLPHKTPLIIVYKTLKALGFSSPIAETN